MANNNNNNNNKPLPTTTTLYQDDDDNSSARTKRFLQKHRLALCCLGLSAAILLILGLIILILALTVLRVKDPQLTMNALRIDRLSLSLPLPLPFSSINATLTADISIKNPNVASFDFRNSTTDFYYEGRLVGVAYAPRGKVKGRRTLRMNVTVDVFADRVAMDTNATEVALGGGGGVNISSFTDVSGRVDLLGVYKRDLDILLNCSFMLGVLEGRFVSRVCVAYVL